MRSGNSDSVFSVAITIHANVESQPYTKCALQMHHGPSIQLLLRDSQPYIKCALQMNHGPSIQLLLRDMIHYV